MRINHESPSPLRGLLSGLLALGLVAVLGAGLAPRATGTTTRRFTTLLQEEPPVTRNTTPERPLAPKELPPIDRAKPKAIATATFGLG